MRRLFQIICLVIATLSLISCASMMALMFDDKKVEQFAAETDPQEIQGYLEWAVERLSESDEDSPDLLAKLMPVAVDQANKIELINSNAGLYSALTDSLIKIAKEGVYTSDPEEWDEDGFPYDVTRDYLRAAAAYNLGQLQGDTIASQLLVILRKVDSPGVQTVVIKSMLNRVDSYKKNQEIQAQAITALSSVDVANLVDHTQLSQLVYQLENELISLSVVNRVLAKMDIYQLSERNLNYILDVNEGLYIHHLNNPAGINKAELIKNSRLLSSLVLPREAQLDGQLPQFSNIQKSAQRLLLQYVPGLYYYSMYENAQLSDYSLGQLVASLDYLNRYDNYALAAKGKLVAVGDEEQLFFNHHQIMNAQVYQTTKIKAKQLVFKSLSKRVETRPYAYIDFIYSFLNLNYPDEFASYLITAMGKKYKAASLDQLQHYYALHLSRDELVAAKKQARLLANVSGAQLSRSLAYSGNEYVAYANKVMPVYVAKQPLALLQALTKRNSKIKNQAGISTLVDYYLVALEQQPSAKRTRYLAVGGQIIAQRNAADSKKVFGSVMSLPLPDTISMLEKYAFADTSSSPTTDYLYLANYLTRHKASIDPNLSSRYAKIFSKGISDTKNEDSSLYAAQQAMALLTVEQDLKRVKSAVKRRFENINI
jgi:hypothetical protein